jgi:hypothetical protein
VEGVLARMASCVDCAPPQAPVSTAEELEKWLQLDVEVFEFLWQNRGLMRLLLSGGGSAQFGYLMDEFAERVQANITRWLRWGVEHGLYRRDLDVEIGALYLSGAYDRIARELVRMQQKPDLVRWLSEVQHLVLRGFGSPAMHAVLDPPVTKAASRRRRASPRRSPAVTR